MGFEEKFEGFIKNWVTDNVMLGLDNTKYQKDINLLLRYHKDNCLDKKTVMKEIDNLLNVVYWDVTKREVERVKIMSRLGGE